jgi:hypothetical protein
MTDECPDLPSTFIEELHNQIMIGRRHAFNVAVFFAPMAKTG